MHSQTGQHYHVNTATVLLKIDVHSADINEMSGHHLHAGRSRSHICLSLLHL